MGEPQVLLREDPLHSSSFRSLGAPDSSASTGCHRCSLLDHVVRVPRKASRTVRSKNRSINVCNPHYSVVKDEQPMPRATTNDASIIGEPLFNTTRDSLRRVEPLSRWLMAVDRTLELPSLLTLRHRPRYSGPLGPSPSLVKASSTPFPRGDPKFSQPRTPSAERYSSKRSLC